MLTRALARPTVAATALAIAALTLAGCSDGASDARGRPAPARSSASVSAPSETATPTPADRTESAEPAEPTGSADTEPADPSGSAEPTDPATSDTATSDTATSDARALRSRLLAAGDLPGFNDTYRWGQGATRSREPRTPFGTCQRFDLTSIGATQVAVRGYRPVAAGTPDHAGELVADFPDSATARRAFSVLSSWRTRCADRLRRWDRSQVGALQDVGVGAGSGGWYLLTYGPLPGDPDSGYFDAQGMALVGSRIALVEMVLGGQDYDYPVGHEPMVTAVKRAAARLS